jgi:ribosome-binding protein aMBF1 (putative translation factor)
MNGADDALRLVNAQRLIASGFTRDVRRAAGLSYRRCAAAIDHKASDVTLWRWERGDDIPSRNAAGAIAYVDFIKRVLRDAAA